MIVIQGMSNLCNSIDLLVACQSMLTIKIFSIFTTTAKAMNSIRVGLTVNLYVILMHILDDDKATSRPSSSTSRQSSIRSSRSRGSSRGSSSRRSRNGIDDQTIRQMFRRYLCSPTKDSDLIKQQLHIIQRELNIILDDDENFSDDDEFDSATGI